MFRSLALVLTLVAPAAMAQNSPGGHFIENWDLDADGAVSATEIVERRDMIFSMFDGDLNDSLDATEYAHFDETRAADMAQNAGGHGNGQGEGGGRMMQGLTLAYNDADGDGAVTRAEFAAGSAGWFEIMDMNGDGSITADDFGRGRN
ncbi:EF-hand domain-containing protein [Octadecabacter sp. R77987]|uniref:EF-hand domain-containing protein n=1 Tax=Octadecabacter sp. R77987 TaxID=3093874 RepID=UPI003672D25A